MREALENLGEMAQASISLVEANVEQLGLILKEHGIRQECVERLNMNGQEFLETSLGQLTHRMNLTQQEMTTVFQHQPIFSHFSCLGNKYKISSSLYGRNQWQC